MRRLTSRSPGRTTTVARRWLVYSVKLGCTVRADCEEYFVSMKLATFPGRIIGIDAQMPRRRCVARILLELA
jgi:hypothetical protein